MMVFGHYDIFVLSCYSSLFTTFHMAKKIIMGLDIFLTRCPKSRIPEIRLCTVRLLNIWQPRKKSIFTLVDQCEHIDQKYLKFPIVKSQ